MMSFKMLKNVRNGLKVVKEITMQSKNNIFIKFRFASAFLLYYTFKQFFGKAPSLFPSMDIYLEGSILKTRKNTLDFWTVWKSYEEETTNYLLEKSNSGYFIDVGANIGRYSVLMAKKGWNVIAFEPVKSTFNQLKTNLTLNDLDAELYNMGLGEKKEEISIYYDREKHAEASIIKDSQKESEKIYIDRLDNLINLFPKENVILKIDVEGFGSQVLKGAINFIRKTRPTIIIEIWEKENESIKLLSDLGYKRAGETEIWTIKPLQLKQIPNLN